MEIVGVDPRDTEFEVDEPVYRVYLWDRPHPPAGLTQEEMAWCCDERRVLGAPDVHTVLNWADEHAGPVGPNSTYTVYVETKDEGRLGLILLAGTDPARGDASSESIAGLLLLGPDDEADDGDSDDLRGSD